MRGLGPATLALAYAALASCAQRREGPPLVPVYDTDIAPILALRCASCHGAAAPAADWSVTSYIGAIACVSPSGAAATLPGDARAPMLAAQQTAPHQGLLTPDEGRVLASWIAAGAPAFRGTVHPPGVVDPRSADWHGGLLRKKKWAPMLDPSDPDACGRCHDGTLSRPPNVTLAAPGATACTTCHSDPQGVLACNTCHGSRAKSYPPREVCFFPNDSAEPDAHAAHVEPSAARAGGLPCSTCHPIPGEEVIGGVHGNGRVEVLFDAALVAPLASYAISTGACAVACHDRGGARPLPIWSDPKPMGCGDCHESPPEGHFVGPCTSCHREANATGTALGGGPLHMNGRVDLGDGSGQCGACHGSGSDPWPTTGAHGAHKTPTLTVPIDCTSCHAVPSTVLAAGHLDGIVQVLFSGRALDRRAAPAWNGSSCSSVACHGAGLVDPPLVVPTWTDTSGAASACGACHGLPPTQHTPQTSCESAICHGSEIARSASNVPSITLAGRGLHIDGVIEPPP